MAAATQANAAPVPPEATDRPATGRWRRPTPAATGPDRGFGGYYRSADRVTTGADGTPQVTPGAPLRSAEDAMAAAVRTGYRIAEAQIARGWRWARPGLGGAAPAGAAEGRSSGDASAGASAPPTPEAAAMLDAIESAIRRGAVFGLQSLETAATDPAHPLRRLVDLELRAMTLLWDGWLSAVRDAGAGRTATAAPAAQAGSAATEPDAATPSTGTSASGSAMPALRQLAPAERRRAVLGVDAHWPVAGIAAGTRLPLHFQCEAPPAGAPRPAPLPATWVAAAGGPGTIEITIDADVPAGRWTAGLYDAEGLQRGWVRLGL